MEFYFMESGFSNYYTEPIVTCYKLEKTRMFEYGEWHNAVRYLYTEPYTYKIKGTRLADFYPLIAGVKLISENLLQVFENEKIKYGDAVPWVCTEWKNRKGAVFDHSELKYYMLKSHKCGALYAADGTEISSRNHTPTDKGFKIDFDYWDGSDVFTFTNVAPLVVTEKVKEIIEKKKLKNIYFDNIKNPRPWL